MNRNVLLIIIAILLAICSYLVSAVCCADMCYDGGICFNDVWYEGCMDSPGTVYPPNAFLNSGCLECQCGDPTDCEWIPTQTGCFLDEFCNVTFDPINVPEDGQCEDRDYHQDICETPYCGNAAFWTWGGEWTTDYLETRWEYFFGQVGHGDDEIECCGDDMWEYYVTWAGRYACCDDSNDCIDTNWICQDEPLGEVSCNDRIDNDCDGDYDCDDTDCDFDFFCMCTPDSFAENCIDGIDNNCDGLTDLEDPACFQGCPASQLGCDMRVLDCTDNITDPLIPDLWPGDVCIPFTPNEHTALHQHRSSL